MNALICNGHITFENGSPICPDWQSVPTNIIITDRNIDLDPNQLILAAGTGVAVGLPLVLTLFGIKMAKKFLMKS